MTPWKNLHYVIKCHLPPQKKDGEKNNPDKSCVLAIFFKAKNVVLAALHGACQSRSARVTVRTDPRELSTKLLKFQILSRITPINTFTSKSSTKVRLYRSMKIFGALG